MTVSESVHGRLYSSLIHDPVRGYGWQRFKPHVFVFVVVVVVIVVVVGGGGGGGSDGGISKDPVTVLPRRRRFEKKKNEVFLSFATCDDVRVGWTGEGGGGRY